MSSRSPTIPPFKKRSLYEILGVERDAMAIDIGLAYKQRLAELSRDPNPDQNELNLVREAYHVLCQPKERENYDASLITREEKAAAAAQAQSPDLVLEPEEPGPGPNKKLWVWAGALALIVLFLTFLVTRSDTQSQQALVPSAEPAPPTAAPPPPPQPRTAPEILALARPSLARIVAYEMSGQAVSAGTGLVVDTDAIVTTCHGLPAGGQVIGKVGKEDIAASLVITDERVNLCRLSVPKGQQPLTLAADEPKVGDKMFAVGFPQGTELSVLPATVKAIRTTPAGKLIELNIPVPAGSSGGALFDPFGRLSGILTARHAGGAGAVPAGAIAQMRTRGTTPAQ